MSDPWKADEPIKEENIINESERDSANPENDEYKLVKLEDDGKVSGQFLRPANIVVFETNGTYSCPANVSHIKVEAVGGGQAGERNGSAAATTAQSGRGGNYGVKIIPRDDITSEVSVVIGSGGVGTTSSSGTPNGSTTSFGAFMSVTGGGESGIGTGADYYVQGEGGENGNNGGQTPAYNRGGSSYLGKGADLRTGNSNGFNGQKYGGGGGGAASTSSSAFKAGGSGANGVVIITEYF